MAVDDDPVDAGLGHRDALCRFGIRLQHIERTGILKHAVIRVTIRHWQRLRLTSGRPGIGPEHGFDLLLTDRPIKAIGLDVEIVVGDGETLRSPVLMTPPMARVTAAPGSLLRDTVLST